MSDAGNDALTQKIQTLLSSPDSMARIQSLMGSLSGDAPSASSSAFSSASPSASSSEPTPSAPSNIGGMDLSMLGKLAPLLGSFNSENEDTRLLKALRPYLHGDREKRLDDAIQLMKLSKLIPLIQKGGEENG